MVTLPVAADGNRTAADGKYVLACRNGTWEPIMTIKEWLDIRSGKRVTIAPLPTRPVPTTTTTTTSTTVLSTIQTIDLGDGREGQVSLSLSDTDEASDGGYHWQTSAIQQTEVGDNQWEVCQYPVLSFGGRATIGGTSYRMDFDGNALGILGPFDLDGPWDDLLDNQPTAHAESITVDWGGVSCFLDEP